MRPVATMDASKLTTLVLIMMKLRNKSQTRMAVLRDRPTGLEMKAWKLMIAGRNRTQTGILAHSPRDQSAKMEEWMYKRNKNQTRVPRSQRAVVEAGVARILLCWMPNLACTYAVAIGYTFKFTINCNRDIPIDLNDLARPLSQPEVICVIDFEIETIPRETQADRSYANIGFVAHRAESIARRKFLHRGFDLPEKIYKQAQNHQTQWGFQGALGFSQGPTGTGTYSRTKGTTLEATNSKVMPKCLVEHENGEEWDQDDKSYSSYNLVYQPQNFQWDTRLPKIHPLEVGVGMGINLRPAASKKPPPQISFVNRNQVLIWVSDPSSKSRIRGIMVLMSSFLDNIRIEEELSIYEQQVVELGNVSLNTPQETQKPGTISLSIAQVQKQGARSSHKVLAEMPSLFTKLLQRSPSCSLTDIPPHEYLARGWDASNNEWRRVLWPALDKDFRAAGFEGKSPVWNIQCPWKGTTETNMGPIHLGYTSFEGGKTLAIQIL
ncbi:hypothetical protein K438DRAFT_774462 [Mycena galopus ATCC 62051]|nr:hypothetical protein K438DRAFT_774462 [Mycena galopus ATCC 62051]